MKHFACLLLVAVAWVSEAHAQRVTRDLPYATAHERQVLDVHASADAKNLAVVFWIHGGGWQTGDKSMGPQARLPRDCVRRHVQHRSAALLFSKLVARRSEPQLQRRAHSQMYGLRSCQASSRRGLR